MFTQIFVTENNMLLIQSKWNRPPYWLLHHRDFLAFREYNFMLMELLYGKLHFASAISFRYFERHIFDKNLACVLGRLPSLYNLCCCSRFWKFHRHCFLKLSTYSTFVVSSSKPLEHISLWGKIFIKFVSANISWQYNEISREI